MLDAGFVSWDDDANFVRNTAYRGLGPEQLRWMWTTFHLGHWMPLSWMTLGLDHALWGMDPRGYHLTNVIIHAAGTATLVAVAARLLGASGANGSSSPRDIALASGFAALIFAIHPLRVESVAWITERRDVLSGFLALLSVWWYLRAAEGGHRARRHHVLAVTCFAAGLLAKATVLTLPALLLVLEVHPLRRLGGSAGWTTPSARRIYRGLLPFTLLSAGSAVMSMVALQDVAQLPILGKVAVSAYSLAFYVAKSVVPAGLSPLYHLPLRVDPLEARFILSLAVVVALSAAVFLARRRWPGLAAGWVIFVLALLPMLGVHQNGPQIAADRYTYHASPALALLAGGGMLMLLRRSRPIALVVGLLVTSALGVATWRQAHIWHDSASLWGRAIATGTGGWIAHNSYGNTLLAAGRVQEAEARFRRSAELNPGYPEAFNDLGVALSQQDRLDEAEPALRRALALRPSFDDAMVNLGVVLGRRGASDEAMRLFASAIRLDSLDLAAEVNWGNTLVRLSRPVEAIPHYERALRIDPENAQAFANLDVARRMAADRRTSAPRP